MLFSLACFPLSNLPCPRSGTPDPPPSTATRCRNAGQGSARRKDCFKLLEKLMVRLRQLTGKAVGRSSPVAERCQMSITSALLLDSLPSERPRPRRAHTLCTHMCVLTQERVCPAQGFHQTPPQSSAQCLLLEPGAPSSQGDTTAQGEPRDAAMLSDHRAHGLRSSCGFVPMAGAPRARRAAGVCQTRGEQGWEKQQGRILI